MKGLTTKDLAEQLRVSRHTIYRMRLAGELPPIIQTSRRIIRWQKSDIELWFDLDCPKAKQCTALKMDMQRFARNGNRGSRKN